MINEMKPNALLSPSSFHRSYPTYKDSGVEWLGPIPTHWETAKVKRLSWFAYGDSLAAEAREEGNVPVYGSNGQVGSHSQANTEAPCLIIGRKGSYGKINYSDSPCFAIDTTFFVDQRYARANLRWLYYTLPLLKLDSFSQDAAVPGLSREFAHQQYLPKLPLPEQCAIADFLDREMTKIDILIAKKERLIGLLQEKRAALISHAVTKGLDPDVPMKDSGIEWLGEIPAHWTVAPIYARYWVQLGKMLDAKQITGEHLAPYIRNIDVQWDRINVTDLKEMDFLPSERERFALKPGDLIICEGGEVGRSAMWQGELDKCYYQKALHRLRPRTSNDKSRFLYHVMYAASKRGVFIAGGNPNTIDHLTAEKLKRYRFGFPPLVEQGQIVTYLDQETIKIDALIAKTEVTIEKLKEYRTALISAAVTGKIDVRETISTNGGDDGETS